MLWVFIAIFTVGCSGMNLGVPASVGNAPVPQIISADPNAPPTPTPFQPMPPTPTWLPTEPPIVMDVNTPQPTSAVEVVEPPQPTSAPVLGDVVVKNWDDYPGPVVWPDIDVPPPVGILPQPEGQVNILLLGSDQRPNAPDYRTDSLLLLTLNPTLGTANLTSFPRDLYIYIPGWTIQRLNTAQAHGGFDLTALMFEYNFGVRPDHYIMINMYSFTSIIDELGGVDVDVAVSLTDHRDGHGNYTVPAGITHMDGETALWYVRSRYTTSDIDRGRRQVEVLKAIFDKMLSLDALNRAGDLYQLYIQGVKTDMTFDDMAIFLPLAGLLRDSSRLHRFSIGSGQVVDWITPNGAYVLLPLREAVLSVIRQALNTP